MNSTASFTGIFGVASVSALAGAFIWWLIRRRRRQMSIPIIRILDLTQTKLPKVVVRRPPMIPFLAFFVAAVAFVIWTTAPKVQVFANHDPKQLRVHVFVDMSPSVSAHVSVTELARSVSALWTDLKNVSRVTLSTSHGDTIYDIQEASKVEELLQGLSYHRAGVSIGNAIKKHLVQTGEIDRLMIVSDRDQHSWAGFQWKYLVGDTEVFWVNVQHTEDRSVKPNAFINGVHIVSAPGSAVHEWDVDISQGGIAKPQEGTLRARKGTETMASTSWKIAEGARGVSIHLSWSTVQDEASRSKRSARFEQEPLLWEITPQGDEGVARIIAEPSGELPLEDPAVGLRTVLQVMGIATERVDFTMNSRPLNASESEASRPILSSAKRLDSDADFWIMLGGLGRGVTSFCPTIESEVQPKAVWVVPWSEDVDHRELCECVTRILKMNESNCSDVHERSQWIDWLSASGAKQLGGEVGQKDGAVAFVFQPSERRANSLGRLSELVALTLPLKPSAKFGVSYGRFPVLVRHLVNWKSIAGTGEGAEALADWPRIADLSRSVAPAASEKVFAASTSLSLSNIPLGESLLEAESLMELPPEWESSRLAQQNRGPGKLDSEDPLPWIHAILIAFFACLFAEFLWLLWARRRNVSRAPL
ncbi:MAG: hypothetical protein NTV34_20035 [Proteobacteria bacterium]|nr:hypothetical protein [Pseudomonadota bacterium]